MKKLLIYLNDYKKESILGPFFKLMEVVFELMVPLVVAAIIDNGISSGDRGYIIRMGLLLVGLGAAGLVCAITAQYFAAKAAAGFAKKLKRSLFAHIQSLSYTELDTVGVSTIITRMTSDVNNVQTGVNFTLRLLLRSPFVVIGAMVMAFSIDVRSALIFAVAIPALFAVIMGITVGCMPLYRRVQERLDKILGITRENLTGARVIRAFCKEGEETEKFEANNEELSRLQKFAGRISTLINPITYVIINLAIIWLINTGAVQVNAGIITQGAVVALYNYMSQILMELIKLAGFIITLTRAMASGNRIQEIFETKSSLKSPEDMPATSESAPAVEFKNVSLRYAGGGGNALEDISFAAAGGETVGIIGGTGAGKTSLVNMIPRFYDAAEGALFVSGADVRDYPVKALREEIGVVPQKAVLFKGSIRENMQWGKKDASDEEIYAALDIAQARDVADSKGGLDYMIEQGGRNLSGGQRQRLTIARALVRRPKILILDDSASALDFITDAALRKALREIEDPPAVFIVSQRAASVHYADRIVVLENGRIACIGTGEELLKTCGVYREIYDSQFKKEGE